MRQGIPNGQALYFSENVILQSILLVRLDSFTHCRCYDGTSNQDLDRQGQVAEIFRQLGQCSDAATRSGACLTSSVPEAKAVMLAETPIDRECRDKPRKLLPANLDWLEERRCLGLEESLAYKFQDVREISLALFIFMEVGLELRGSLYCSANGKLSSNATTNRRPLSGLPLGISKISPCERQTKGPLAAEYRGDDYPCHDQTQPIS